MRAIRESVRVTRQHLVVKGSREVALVCEIIVRFPRAADAYSFNTIVYDLAKPKFASTVTLYDVGKLGSRGTRLAQATVTFEEDRRMTEAALSKSTSQRCCTDLRVTLLSMSDNMFVEEGPAEALYK
jgi:hypothetical protein